MKQKCRRKTYKLREKILYFLARNAVLSTRIILLVLYDIINPLVLIVGTEVYCFCSVYNKSKQSIVYFGFMQKILYLFELPHTLDVFGPTQH